MLTQTQYIETITWKQFLLDLSVYFESDSGDSANIIETIEDISSFKEFAINVMERVLSQEHTPQQVMDDFLKTCICHPRYVMEISETIEQLIRTLIAKGAIVSANIVLNSRYIDIENDDSKDKIHLEDEGNTFKIRGFLHSKFLRKSHPISYNALYWEDCIVDQPYLTKENFLGAIRYESDRQKQLTFEDLGRYYVERFRLEERGRSYTINYPAEPLTDLYRHVYMTYPSEQRNGYEPIDETINTYIFQADVANAIKEGNERMK
jgi:hypothetical protein